VLRPAIRDTPGVAEPASFGWSRHRVDRRGRSDGRRNLDRVGPGRALVLAFAR
jgi:hypothetical protein